MTYRPLPVTANGQTRDIGLYDTPTPITPAPDPLGSVNLSGRIEAPDSRDAIGWGVGGMIGGGMLASALDVLVLVAAMRGGWQPIDAVSWAAGMWLTVPVCFIGVFTLRLTARHRLDTRQREALPPPRTYVKVDNTKPAIDARPVDSGNADAKRHVQKLIALVARAADGNTRIVRRDGKGERYVTVAATGDRIGMEEQVRLYGELAAIGIMVKDSKGWRLADTTWTRDEALGALVEAFADD